MLRCSNLSFSDFVMVKLLSWWLLTTSWCHLTTTAVLSETFPALSEMFHFWCFMSAVKWFSNTGGFQLLEFQFSLLCINMHICTHTHTHTFTFRCLHANIHACRHVCMHVIKDHNGNKCLHFSCHPYILMSICVSPYLCTCYACCILIWTKQIKSLPTSYTYIIYVIHSYN